MYAMVNVRQYQIVATGTSVAACLQNYEALLMSGGIVADSSVPDETATAAGAIEDLRSAVLEGTTYYFLRLEGDPLYYQVSAAVCREAVLLNVGDEVTVTFHVTEGEIADVILLEKS